MKKEKNDNKLLELNNFLKNQKILEIKQFRLNEIVIICENYRFFIDSNNSELEFSITEN